MEKIFKKKYLSFLKALVGCRCINISRKNMQNAFGMDDMYIFTFNNLYSLHVISTVRIVINDKIILNTSDEATTASYDEWKKSFTGKEQYCCDNLLYYTLRRSMILLYNSIISSVNISSLGDIELVHNNGLKIQILIDAQYNGEYYRIIDENMRQYVVGYSDGRIIYEDFNAIE